MHIEHVGAGDSDLRLAEIGHVAVFVNVEVLLRRLHGGALDKIRATWTEPANVMAARKSGQQAWPKK